MAAHEHPLCYERLRALRLGHASDSAPGLRSQEHPWDTLGRPTSIWSPCEDQVEGLASKDSNFISGSRSAMRVILPFHPGPSVVPRFILDPTDYPLPSPTFRLHGGLHLQIHPGTDAMPQATASSFSRLQTSWTQFSFVPTLCLCPLFWPTLSPAPAPRHRAPCGCLPTPSCLNFPRLCLRAFKFPNAPPRLHGRPWLRSLVLYPFPSTSGTSGFSSRFLADASLGQANPVPKSQ